MCVGPGALWPLCVGVPWRQPTARAGSRFQPAFPIATTTGLPQCIAKPRGCPCRCGPPRHAGSDAAACLALLPLPAHYCCRAMSKLRDLQNEYKVQGAKLSVAERQQAALQAQVQQLQEQLDAKTTEAAAAQLKLEQLTAEGGAKEQELARKVGRVGWGRWLQRGVGLLGQAGVCGRPFAWSGLNGHGWLPLAQRTTHVFLFVATGCCPPGGAVHPGRQQGNPGAAAGCGCGPPGRGTV